METTKRTKKKSMSTLSVEDIAQKYKEYLLMNGSAPASVYKFCLDLGISEEEFYSHFGSFEGLEKSIWKGYIEDAIGRLEGDKAFKEFSTQEKVLAFYYTLIEIFKTDRSFILLILDRPRKLELIPGYIKDFKRVYEEFMTRTLGEGMKSGDVATRPYLDKRYPQLFWTHFVLMLLYWKEDDSKGFEKTDAYIEKSVRLAFDLIGKGVVDSAIDFAKFLYQTKLRD